MERTRSGDGNILVVEDDQDARLLLDSALESNGFEGTVEVETDGLQALDRVTDEERLDEIALVILDLDLPGADGMDVLEAIREGSDRNDLPVVVLTNNKDEAMARRAYELGANCWIRKPAHFTRLEAAIGGVLELLGPSAPPR